MGLPRLLDTVTNPQTSLSLCTAFMRARAECVSARLPVGTTECLAFGTPKCQATRSKLNVRHLPLHLSRPAL